MKQPKKSGTDQALLKAVQDRDLAAVRACIGAVVNVDASATMLTSTRGPVMLVFKRHSTYGSRERGPYWDDLLGATEGWHGDTSGDGM